VQGRQGLMQAALLVVDLRLHALLTTILLSLQFFHLYMNILAEVTHFGDREFYKDWWNATTIGDYWRLWNMPVHKWMMRTVYSPLVRSGAFTLILDTWLD
jgi:diacylglycerol O-acyltransferase 1